MSNMSDMSGQTNPFARMGIDPTFALDTDALQARFLALSAEHHPDRFSDPADQADAADRIARINEAYQTLSDPERRANALLAVLGGPAPEDDKSLPQDLLSEMIDIRERQEEATESGDEAKIRELADWARDRRDTSLKRIAMLFKMATMGDDVQQEKLAIIRVELNALRYYERMIEQLPDLAGQTG